MDPLQRLFNALDGSPSVLLTGPLAADGDSLGASLALARVLRARGLTVEVTGDPGKRYAFMPDTETLLSDAAVAERAAEQPWHSVIVLDGDRKRLPPGVEQAWAAAELRGVVDHHVSTTTEGYEVCWLDGAATSTCQMLFGAFEAHGIELDETLATLLHTGNVFDTGGFRFENATPPVFRAAAACIEQGADHVTICTRVLQERRWRSLMAFARILGSATRLGEGRIAVATVTHELAAELELSVEDLEGVVDNLLYVEGVEVAALIYAFLDRPKVSLRSRGSVDVARLAARLAPTGGGHRKAAGARTDQPVEAIYAELERALPPAH